MIRKCYKLTFLSPLHVSSGGFGLESADAFVHSDTLYSALCSVAANFWDEHRLQEFFFKDGNAAFRISSAFPFYQGGYFFPRPFSYEPPGLDELPYPARKKWKNVRFIEHNIWKKIAEGESVMFDEADEKHNKGCWNVLPFPGKGFRLYEELEMPRVTLDRVAQTATIFHFAQVEFAPGAGLFLLAEFENESDAQAFETLLVLLSETGIGGDRSVGKGQFEFEEGVLPEWPTPKNADGFTSLSLYIPDNDELTTIDFQDSWYRFLLRQGWIHNNTLRRKTLRMFSEGSVFRHTREKTATGKLIKALDRTEFPNHLTHDVWRSGLAFTIPFQLPKE